MMPRPKILYISHSSYLFGAENCLLSLVAGLDTSRFEAAVVLPTEGPLKQKLDELGIRTHILELEWWAKNEGRLLHTRREIPLALDKLQRIIDEERPNVIHSNTSVVCWGAVAAAMAGVRHVWHAHEILNGHPSLEPLIPLPLLFEAMSFLSEKVVAVSSAVREELAGFIPSDKLQVIHNGVPFVEPAGRQSFRSEIRASDDEMVVLTVTSLQKHKGLDNLLSAAAAVADKNDKIVFAIAGTGSRDAIASLHEGIGRHNIQARVHYLGYRSDVPQLLAESDLFVLPSTLDAFPLAVLEAMSQGKPVVATDSGGTREMIVEGETGFIVPVEDPQSLAAKILEVCGNKVKRVSMAQAAAKRYADCFSTQRYVSEFAALYEDVIAGPKPPLTSRQRSFLTSFVAAYIDYLKTMRVIPKIEQDLAFQKRQLQELNLLLAQKQEALVLAEKERARDNQQFAEKILTLVTQFDKRSQEQIDQFLAQLNEKQLQISEFQAMLQHAQVKLDDRDERIRQIEEVVARERESVEEEIRQADEAARQEIEAVRRELETKMKQKAVELADRDQQWRQIREEIARQAILVEEKLALKERSIRDLEGRLKTTAEQLNSAEQTLSSLRSSRDAEIDAYKQAIAERDQRIEDLLASLSWRVTGPLRKAYDLVLAKK